MTSGVSSERKQERMDQFATIALNIRVISRYQGSRRYSRDASPDFRLRSCPMIGDRGDVCCQSQKIALGIGKYVSISFVSARKTNSAEYSKHTQYL
jgi:hypothetical protein